MAGMSTTPQASENSPVVSPTPATKPASTRTSGAGRVLIAVYGILAIAATGRSGYQLYSEFSAAPIAISLSAVAAVVYVVATVALITRGTAWYRVALVAISFELLGVLVVGTLSLIDPVIFDHKATVWSVFGIGYGFVPLVLPFVGLWWLRRHTPENDLAEQHRAASPVA